MRLEIGCAVLLLVMIVPFNAEATPITYGIAGVFVFSVEPLLPPGTPSNRIAREVSGQDN